MRTLILAAVSVVALLGPALADDGSQIRVVGYSATRRTEVVGIVGQPTTFTFPVGEQVYRIVQTGSVGKDGVIGDAGWQGPTVDDLKLTPLVNNLPLWPVRPGTSTMTVITTMSDGVQKVYPFRLIARAAGDDDAPDAALNLIFNGTAKPPVTPVLLVGKPVPAPTQAAIVAWRTAQKEKAEAKLREDRAAAFNPAPDATCGFEAHGKQTTTIAPKCPLTDGQWTLFRFAGLSKKPAIYIGSCVEGKDEERLARQHEEADRVVVEEIAPNFCLRLGSDVLDIINDRYDPVGRPSDSGTVNPGIKRELIKAAAH